MSSSRSRIAATVMRQRVRYAIGDSPNDYDMFPIATRSYLVSDMECPYEVDREPSILEALLDAERRITAGVATKGGRA